MPASTVCHRSNMPGTCDTCGGKTAALHMPMGIHGLFCEHCCEACHPIDRKAVWISPGDALDKLSRRPRPMAG
jgi:hypothetical protein